MLWTMNLLAYAHLNRFFLPKSHTKYHIDPCAFTQNLVVLLHKRSKMFGHFETPVKPEVVSGNFFSGKCMLVQKKDNSLEAFSSQKIEIAVNKAAARCDKHLDKASIQNIVEGIYRRIKDSDTVTVAQLHELVIAVLNITGNEDVAKSYAEYRYYKTNYAKTFEKLRQDADDVLRLGDRENANFDSSLVSTKGSLIKGYLTKSLYRQFYLSKRELELIDRGDIYAHDLRDMILGCVNCFSGNTRFISDAGVRSFQSFNDGDVVRVPTHKGNWKRAVVRRYGKQQLQLVYLKRGSSKEKKIAVTPNHRWILADGSETTNLKVGDRLCATPRICDYSWDSLSLTDKRIWCMGFNLGDGSACRESSSMIRLCGDKNKWVKRFEDAQFKVTYPEYYDGDARIYMRGVLKQIPFGLLHHENIKVFAHGLMCADGNKQPQSAVSEFRSICAMGKINDYVESILSPAGYYVSSKRDITDRDTNFGHRSDKTIRYQIYSDSGCRNWHVTRIQESHRVEDVWCLEVEDDHSFLLEGGIPTGNCCLFDIGTVMKDGFEMSNVQYNEPKSVLSALQVVGDITLVATAQQFGGFTLAELDKVLLPYVRKTYNRAYDEALNTFKLSALDATNYAERVTQRELEQGFQSLELKLNTVPCSRGDFAFTTITFGEWDINAPEEDKRFLNMIGTAILRVRRNGHGKDRKPVVFPKLVYLYDQKQIDKDAFSKALFDEAVETSSKCMYPDYLSLSSKYGTVSRLFQQEGVITSPMGCRAYLSPWQDPVTGKYVAVGRCNIGAVSLNIPLLIKIAQTEGGDDWQKAFWEILQDRLEVIRDFLKKRYDVIRNQRCSSNPLAFTQGGFYNGTKDPDDRVGDLVKYMTASFGITALDEATYLWTRNRLINDTSFATEVLKYLNNAVAEFKKQDGHLYALYGTPAESLTGTQARQYDDYCKAMGVENEFKNCEHYSPEYFSNSFHVNVTEDITPFEKQDIEQPLFHLCEGGHIQYVRLTNPENKNATKAIIERGMEMGFYQGVNFDSAYCNDCGKHSTNVMFKCPHCGSDNLSVISRVCGYLGYSNVNGKTRMNDAKMAEINNRVSM